MSEEKLYSLSEAQKILAKRAQEKKIKDTIHDLRRQVVYLKNIHNSTKRAHKNKVKENHQQDKHIAKLYNIIDKMATVTLHTAKEMVRDERAMERKELENSFRANRKARKQRAASRKAARAAEEANNARAEASRKRLALEAKHSEEKRVQSLQPIQG